MASPSLALASISIRDFRGIDHLELSFRGPDGLPNQLVVLAGPNGSGKTAVLEAALIAVGGDNLVVGPKGRQASRKGATDYEILASISGRQGETEVRATSQGLSAAASIPHWYFSSWRAPLRIGPLDVTAGKPGRRPLKNDANRLRNVKQLLVNAAAKAHFPGRQQNLLEQYYDWMDSINRAWANFYTEAPGKFVVDLVESDQEGTGAFELFYDRPGSERLEVDYLSAGQLELFLFLAALVLNDDREGIVFIDEPELHLDPQWHRPILRSLIRLQPKAQFIVASHSPEIYDAARSYERHFLVPEDDPRARLWRPVDAEV